MSRESGVYLRSGRRRRAGPRETLLWSEQGAPRVRASRPPSQVWRSRTEDRPGPGNHARSQYPSGEYILFRKRNLEKLEIWRVQLKCKNMKMIDLRIKIFQNRKFLWNFFNSIFKILKFLIFPKNPIIFHCSTSTERVLSTSIHSASTSILMMWICAKSERNRYQFADIFNSFPIVFQLPDSCLPFGMEIENHETKVVPMEPSPAIRHHLFAFSPSQKVDETVVTSAVYGFCLVTEVRLFFLNKNKKRITWIKKKFFQN